MRPDQRRGMVLVVLSAVAGCLGWNGNVLLLPAAALFPAIWSLAKSRCQAAAVSAAYFLAASHGLPQGVANFYASDLWPGLALWLLASAAFVIVHSALWAKVDRWKKPARFLAAMAVMSVPPFGITGWAHPITAAGVLFPGWRWWGLGMTAAALTVMTTRYRGVAAIAMAGVWLWSAQHWSATSSPASWQGIDLRFGVSLGRDASLERQQALFKVLRHRPSGTTVVLPESTIRFWTPTVARLWQAEVARADITVIAGAAIVDESGYDNVLIRISRNGSDILYRERMPVPGSMWQPWRDSSAHGGGARAHFFANPVVDIGGVKTAPLICYEQLIVWPVLQSMLYEPDIILAVGNGWWTAGTSIVEIQRASAAAWAALFDKPLVLSFNTASELNP